MKRLVVQSAGSKHVTVDYKGKVDVHKQQKALQPLEECRKQSRTSELQKDWTKFRKKNQNISHMLLLTNFREMFISLSTRTWHLPTVPK